MCQNAFETLLDILFTNTGKHFKGFACKDTAETGNDNLGLITGFFLIIIN